MDYATGNYRAERAERAEIGVGFVSYMSFPTRCLFTLQIGHKKYLAYDLQSLLEEEIQLQCSQANDALHKLHLALVDRAIMLRTDVQHAKSQAMTTKAWLKVTNVQNAVQ